MPAPSETGQLEQGDTLGGLWSQLQSLGKSVGGGLEGLWSTLQQHTEETGKRYGEAIAEISRPDITPMRGGQEIRSVAEAPEGEPVAAGAPQPGTLEHARQQLQAARGGVLESPGGQAALAFAGSTIGEGGVPGVPGERAGLPAIRAEPPPLREGAAPPQQPPRLPPGGEPPGLPPPPGPQQPGMIPREEVTATTAPPLELPAGPVKETPEMVTQRLGAMHWAQDQLHTLATQAESDRLQLNEKFQQLSELTDISPNDKRNIEANLEWQQGMPKAPVMSPRAQRVFEELDASRARGLADYKWLQEHTAIDPELLQKTDINEGYLHRIRLGPQRPAGASPFQPFAGVRSLRQQASSQKGREFYVVQNARGDRVFIKGQPPAPYSSKHPGDAQWEIRRATMSEVEGNTDIRYMHEPVLSTFQNEMQLRLARRNVEMLQNNILPQMIDRGLASKRPADQERLGFEPSIVPAMRGYLFEPRLAKAFNDFYRTPNAFGEPGARAHSPIDQFGFGALNRFAINAMFLNPLPHMLNVAADYGLARGGLWFVPPAYARGAQAMRQAFNDVWNKTPFYHQILKEGGTLMGASASNRVAENVLWKRITDEMQRDPMVDRIAKEAGLKSGRNWGQQVWDKSQNLMWGFHDLVLTARVRELTNQGMALKPAINEAEKWIASYRVPASIGEAGKVKLSPNTARFLSRLMQDRTVTVFGRYHYHVLSAIGQVMRDAGRAMTQRGMSGADQADALGRFAFMAIAATVVPYGMSLALQKATGNPEAKVSAHGAIRLAEHLADATYKSAFGEGNHEWWSTLSSILTPMPAVEEALNLRYNKDLFSGQPIRDEHLGFGQQAAEVGTHIGKAMLSPAQEALQMGRMIGSGAQQGGIPSLGISTPNPRAVAAARAGRVSKPQLRRELRHYQRTVPWVTP